MALFIVHLGLGGCIIWSPVVSPLSTLELPDGASAVVLRDEYAFVTSGHGGLSIIDLHKPETPTVIGVLELDYFVNTVTVSDNRAYLGAGLNGSGYLLIVDISTLTSPQLTSAYNVGGNPLKIKVKGTIAFVAAAGGGLVILDVTDPTQPQELSRRPLNNRGSSISISDINVVGDLAYVDPNTGGQVILDISDPAWPKIVFEYDDTRPTSLNGTIKTWGQYGCARTDGGVDLFDLSMPTHPKLISTIHTPRYVTDVAPFGNSLFVTDYYMFWVYDVSAPERPREIGHLQVSQGWAIDVSKDYAILADQVFGLYIFDIRAFQS